MKVTTTPLQRGKKYVSTSKLSEDGIDDLPGEEFLKITIKLLVAFRKHILPIKTPGN